MITNYSSSKKMFSRIVKLIPIWSLLFSLVISPVLADGALMECYPDDDYFRLINQTQQAGFIDYIEGNETLTLAVNTRTSISEHTVWVFPLPSSPEETEINIIDETPKVFANNLFKETIDSTNNIFGIMRVSQIYTLPFYLFRSLVFHITDDYPMELPNEISTMQDKSTVEVYQHIEKLGFTSELISTKSGSDLRKYFEDKDLQFIDDYSVIDDYIGSQYIFVVSWVSDPSQLKRHSNKVAIETKFPTEKLFFPLKLTSIYGKEHFPIVVYINNFVSPEIYTNIKDDTQIEYYTKKEKFELKIEPSYDDYPGKHVYTGYKNFTKITINTDSTNFTEDLWINRDQPIKATIGLKILTNPIPITLILFIAISLFSSLVAFIIVFSKYKFSISKAFIIGALNIFSLLGVIVGTTFLFRPKNKSLKNNLNASQQKSHSTEKLAKRIILSLELMILILVCGTLFFTLAYTGITIINLIIIGSFFVLPFIILLCSIIFLVKKERSYEKARILNNTSPSSYLFRKIAFISIFSVVFISLTAVIQLIIVIFYDN